MTYITECSLRNFPSRKQAKKNLEKIKSYDKENETSIFNALEIFCENLFCDNNGKEDDVNNFLTYELSSMKKGMVRSL